MERTKRILYMPYWIQGMMERNNLPLSDFLDVRKMMKFFSQRELANILTFQNLSPFDDECIDGKLVPSFMTNCITDKTDITKYRDTYELSQLWRRQLELGQSAEDKDLLRLLSSVQYQYSEDYVKNEIAARFDPDNAIGLKHDEPFITYELDSENAVVVVYPGFFKTGVRNQVSFALCRAVLKVLYVYNKYTAGCTTPYFRKYLELLV